MHIEQYTSAKDFYEVSKNYLYKSEIENNLIIGVCNKLINKTLYKDDYVFINVVQENEVIASSVKTLPKAIVCSNDNKEAIKMLAEYYKSNKIYLMGAIGEKNVADLFGQYYYQNRVKSEELFIYSLENVNDIPVSDGVFGSGEKSNYGEITNLVNEFCMESNVPNKYDVAELLRLKKIFVWKYDGKISSIAAIIRETTHAAIIGMVYTPKEHRKRGFATSCVKELSHHALNNGYKYCGLFTEATNPISNSIYQKIGYRLVSVFSDIHFNQKA